MTAAPAGRSLVFLALVASFLGSAVPARAHAPSAASVAALRLVDLLRAADGAAAHAMFDDTMKGALPADQVGALWAGLEMQLGAHAEVGEPHEQAAGGMTVVVVPLRFERGTVDAAVTVLQDGKVAGLFFRPAAPPAPPAAARTPLRVAKDVVAALSRGDVADLAGLLDLGRFGTYPEDAVARFEEYEDEHGAFVADFDRATESMHDGMTEVRVPARFGEEPMRLVVSVGDDGRAALFLLPSRTPVPPIPAWFAEEGGADAPHAAADEGVPPRGGAPRAVAEAVLQELRDGRFDALGERYSAAVASQLTAAQTRQNWEGLLGQVGDVREVGELELRPAPGVELFVRPIHFQRATLDLGVAVDADGAVAGFWIRPRQAAAAAPAGPPPDDAPFVERELALGEGAGALPGTLTVPRGEGPFPGVVLVHGSGPNDRDETVGAAKPFRDLAWGLAERGLVVYRYDKRSRAHPMAMSLLADRVTVEDVTVRDAVAAVDLLRGLPEVDPERVVVLGHSLGALMGPRIATRNPDVAALVLVAAPARPLEDVLVPQFRHVFTATDGELSDAEAAQIEQIAEQVRRVKSPELSLDTPAKELPLGLPASFWLDLRGYDPVAVTQQLPLPVFVIHGGRDYQVTLDDFALWRSGLAGRTATWVRLYPRLNHLMIAGDGVSTPAEYQRPGHVDDAIVRDVSRFVEALVAARPGPSG